MNCTRTINCIHEMIKSKLSLFFLIYNATFHCYIQEIKYYFSEHRSKVTDGGI